MSMHTGMPLRLIRRRAIGASSVLSLLAACQQRTPEADMSCAPVSDSLARPVSADILGGEFALTLVATEGPAAGRTAVGKLFLQPYDSATRAGPPSAPIHRAPDTHRVYGRAEIALDSIGASAAGSISGADPFQPGVLGIEWTEPPSNRRHLTLRFGSEANRRDLAAFDGAYTALSVHSVTGTGFAGDWKSGGTGTDDAGGHFCAERVRPR